jgi:hypothetical protein
VPAEASVEPPAQPEQADAAVDADSSADEAVIERTAADLWAGATWSDEGVSEGVSEGEDQQAPLADAPPQVAPRSGASVLSDVEPAVTTRVSVSGLASVAGVTSFRRHVARLEGVQGVAVNARSDGSFEFDVTHHPNVRLDDELPGLPGFDARVMGAESDALTVYASDPLRYP